MGKAIIMLYNQLPTRDSPAFSFAWPGSEVHHLCNIERIALGENHICSLHGYVSSCTNRNPYVCLSQRWAIIYPVTNHGHSFSLRLELSDFGGLVPRQYIGKNNLDLKLCCDAC
jgi:hypothetical protein